MIQELKEVEPAEEWKAEEWKNDEEWKDEKQDWQEDDPRLSGDLPCKREAEGVQDIPSINSRHSRGLLHEADCKAKDKKRKWEDDKDWSSDKRLGCQFRLPVALELQRRHAKKDWSDDKGPSLCLSWVSRHCEGWPARRP